MNRLYYGDNLDVLREDIEDASVSLIYLDPPFNSNASYNILFRSPVGGGTDASIEAFGDTWEWGPSAAGALMDVAQAGNHKLHTLMQAMKTAIGENAMMAYLAMMAVRLVELHRVLKPTGSLYLHCDPTASHYLKLVLDAVFGTEQFASEVIWKRTAAHSATKRWGNVHDTIFFYTKSQKFTWNSVYLPHSSDYQGRYKNKDDRGRVWADDNLTAPGLRSGFSGQPWRGFDVAAKGSHWKISAKAVDAVIGAKKAANLNTLQKLDVLDADGLIHWPKSGGFPRFKRVLSQGSLIQDIITDIPPINSQAAERLGYPTQKPIALLERIIAASSNPGDVVLDPFCGCGTTVDAAQKLGRQWTGVDITVLAIDEIVDRLKRGYGDSAKFDVIGLPADLQSAQRLAATRPHDFQNWICRRIGGHPWEGGKKGGDKGVDGYFYYLGDDGAIETGVISVKAGANINPSMVRDLGRVMVRDGHRFGVFACAAMPTSGMEKEAASHGLVEIVTRGSTDQSATRFPALQIFTLAELFQHRKPDLPPLVSGNRRAVRVETRASHKPGAQGALL